jgi:methionine synthase I (cobalamin-dependent)
MHRLLERFPAGLVITDGAWGTELSKRGLAPGEVPDLWNLTHPDAVEAVARVYVEAGSQVILTNTFRANPVALATCGASEQAAAINRRGVEISRAAAAGTAPVFASLGPTGKTRAAGAITAEDVSEAFRIQAEALAAGGADALVLETFSDVEDAVARVPSSSALW